MLSGNPDPKGANVWVRIAGDRKIWVLDKDVFCPVLVVEPSRILQREIPREGSKRMCGIAYIENC